MKKYTLLIFLLGFVPQLAHATYAVTPTAICGSQTFSTTGMGSQGNDLSIWDPSGNWAGKNHSGDVTNVTLASILGGSPVSGVYHMAEVGAGITCDSAGGGNYAFCSALIPSQFYPDLTYTAQCPYTPVIIASTTVPQVDNPNLDIFLGFLLFYITMAMFIWIFKKK